MKLLPVVLVVLVAVPALAVDGVREINQVCALVGCFDGDAAGFPVEIGAFEGGSYRLTSNLILGPSDPAAIVVASPFTTIDLNGHFIRGLNDCSGTTGAVTCSNTSFSVGIISSAAGTSVRDGGVHGVGGNGIDLREHAQIEDVSVSDMGGNGIVLGSHSLLDNVRVWEIAANGVVGQSGAAGISIARSQVNVVGGQAVVFPVSSGAGNLCDDGSCQFVATRLYYLTPKTVDGANATSQCDVGFHMASMSELIHPASLRYDTNRGVTSEDSGAGPPDARGWVRTGRPANAAIQQPPGLANCDAWTSGDTSLQGSSVALDAIWSVDQPTNPPSNFKDRFPWTVGSSFCSAELGVWCVQD